MVWTVARSFGGWELFARMGYYSRLRLLGGQESLKNLNRIVGLGLLD